MLAYMCLCLEITWPPQLPCFSSHPLYSFYLFTYVVQTDFIICWTHAKWARICLRSTWLHFLITEIVDYSQSWVFKCGSWEFNSCVLLILSQTNILFTKIPFKPTSPLNEMLWCIIEIFSEVSLENILKLSQ